jgi:hypothetical protein
MDIQQIWISQRGLRRFGQVPKMVEDLHNGKLLPKITLSRYEDGEIQLKDGHHRLTAIWLSGRKKLEDHEYLLIETEVFRPRFGKITDLLQRINK